MHISTRLLCLLTATLCIPAAYATDNKHLACKVADPELQGTFVGQCDGWGIANGYASVQGSATYVGEFKDGKKHGYGVKTWKNGEQYIGQFDNDAKNGFGIYKWAPQATRYAGDPKAGSRDVYIGQFLNDQRNGDGAYEWASGDVYRGQWAQDKFISTPTPMMQLQARHEKALAGAVKKPDASVCQAIQEGTTRAYYLQGTVNRVEGDNLLVLLQTVPENLHGTFKVGQTIRSSYLNWEPCNVNTQKTFSETGKATKIAADEDAQPFNVDTIAPVRD